MERTSGVYVFAMGAALGLAQGSLAFGFQVAVTGSVIGYLITMISWCAGSALGLWRTQPGSSGWLALLGLLLCMGAGTAAMVHWQSSVSGYAAGALCCVGAGFAGGRLIALCDHWGIPPDALMALENLGFVLSFCATVLGLLFLGVQTYAVLVGVTWLLAAISLPLARRAGLRARDSASGE